MHMYILSPFLLEDMFSFVEMIHRSAASNAFVTYPHIRSNTNHTAIYHISNGKSANQFISENTFKRVANPHMKSSIKQRLLGGEWTVVPLKNRQCLAHC